MKTLREIQKELDYLNVLLPDPHPAARERQKVRKETLEWVLSNGLTATYSPTEPAPVTREEYDALAHAHNTLVGRVNVIERRQDRLRRALRDATQS